MFAQLQQKTAQDVLRRLQQPPYHFMEKKQSSLRGYHEKLLLPMPYWHVSEAFMPQDSQCRFRGSPHPLPRMLRSFPVAVTVTTTSTRSYNSYLLMPFKDNYPQKVGGLLKETQCILPTYPFVTHFACSKILGRINPEPKPGEVSLFGAHLTSCQSSLNPNQP